MPPDLGDFFRMAEVKRLTMSGGCALALAATERLTLLTRDAKRYRSYFPSVELIVPA